MRLCGVVSRLFNDVRLRFMRTTNIIIRALFGAKITSLAKSSFFNRCLTAFYFIMTTKKNELISVFYLLDCILNWCKISLLNTTVE